MSHLVCDVRRFVTVDMKERMTLRFAVETIVSSARNESPGAVVGVCIGVDEVQKLASWGIHMDSTPGPGKVDGVSAVISRILKPLVGWQSEPSGWKYLVCAGVAGTAVNAIQYLKSGDSGMDASGERAEIVALPLLSNMDGISQLTQSGATAFQPHRDLSAFFSEIRDFPRLMELAVLELLAPIRMRTPLTGLFLNQILRAEIQKYVTDKFSNGIVRFRRAVSRDCTPSYIPMVALCFLQERRMLTDVCPRVGGSERDDLTFGELVESGRLAIAEGGDTVLVPILFDMPLAYLRQCMNDLPSLAASSTGPASSGFVARYFVNSMLAVLAMMARVDPEYQQWEEYVAHILSLRINAALLVGRTTMTVGELFAGARYCGGVDPSQILSLSPSQVIKSETVFGCGVASLSASGSDISPWTPCLVILNHTGGIAIDVIVSCGKLTFSIQLKRVSQKLSSTVHSLLSAAATHCPTELDRVVFPVLGSSNSKVDDSTVTMPSIVLDVDGLQMFAGGMLCRLPLFQPRVNINDAHVSKTLLSNLVIVNRSIDEPGLSSSKEYFVKALLELRDKGTRFGSLTDVQTQLRGKTLKQFRFGKGLPEKKKRLNVDAFTFDPRVIYEWM